MITAYRLIDAVLTRFGTGYCPYCHHFTWCVLIWNDQHGRFNPACEDCAPGQLGVTRERYHAMLEEPVEDEALEIEEPMTTGQLVRTIIGLVIVDALFTFGALYLAAHDPRKDGPFLYWVIIPLINLVAVGMAALQVYFYTHPEALMEDDEEESEEGNS